MRWFVFASQNTPGVSIVQHPDLDISAPWVPRLRGQAPQNALITDEWLRYAKLAINYEGKEFIATWKNKDDTDQITLFWNDGSDQSTTWTGQTPLPFYNGLIQSSGTKEVIVLYLKTGTDNTKIYMRRESDSFATESELNTVNRPLAKLIEVDTGAYKPTRNVFSLWAEDEDGQLIELESDGYSGQQSAGDYWYSPDCSAHEDVAALNSVLDQIGFDVFADVTDLGGVLDYIQHGGLVTSTGAHTDAGAIVGTIDDVNHVTVVQTTGAHTDDSSIVSTIDDVTYTVIVQTSGAHTDDSALSCTTDEIDYETVTVDGGTHTEVTAASATIDEITHA